MYRERIGWTSSKLISWIISFGSSLLRHRQSSLNGTTLTFRWYSGAKINDLGLLKPAISLKRGKVGPRLLLMTNRKSHMRFRLVPKSATLDDLEGPLRTLFQNTCVVRLSETTTKIWIKIDPYYQRRRCSPVTLDSCNIRFMRIFAGVPWRGASNHSKVIKNIDFQGFRTLRLRHLRKWSQHYYMVLLFQSLVAFPLIPKYMTLNDLEWLNGHFTLNFHYY